MVKGDEVRGERRKPGRGSQAPPPGWTIGHSTRSLEEFLGVLDTHGIERLADVRRFPLSRRHPQFNRESLAEALARPGIEYSWIEELGGRRSAESDSPNRGIRVAGFRGYADYMRTPAFARAFDELVAWMHGGRTAIMCAERLWWQCHRRLLSDLLVARGGQVHHILDAERTDEHELWDIAVAAEDGLLYPPPQGDLDLEG